MLIIAASKMLVIASVMTTLAGAALGTAVLFASYILGAAKNPEEAENLFNTTLMAFALVETFVFLSFLIAGVTYLAL
jgi:F0F1-type ATP synthase membrane subunit c/vacuolar-type H+-ATPase subunit K